MLRNWEMLPAVMLCLCGVAETTTPDDVQGLASVSGKRSATGVATDDNGMTFARTPGQVSSSCMRMVNTCIAHACNDCLSNGDLCFLLYIET